MKDYQDSKSKTIKKLIKSSLFFEIPLVKENSDQFISFCSAKNLKTLRPFLKTVKQPEDLPLPKLKKLFFVFLIAKKPELFITKWQLCSTFYGKQLEVNSATVINWLKELMKLEWLKCTSKAFYEGSQSRSYTIEKTDKNQSFTDMINDFNGFKKKYPGVKKNETVIKIRKERIKKFPFTSYRVENCCYLAQSYLDKPEEYLKLFMQKRFDFFNFSPRTQNPSEINLKSAVIAFNYVMKRNNRKSRINNKLLESMGIFDLKSFIGEHRKASKLEKKRLVQVKNHAMITVQLAPGLKKTRQAIQDIATVDLAFTGGFDFELGKVRHRKIEISSNNYALMVAGKLLTMRVPKEVYSSTAKNLIHELPDKISLNPANMKKLQSLKPYYSTYRARTRTLSA